MRSNWQNFRLYTPTLFGVAIREIGWHPIYVNVVLGKPVLQKSFGSTCLAFTSGRAELEPGSLNWRSAPAMTCKQDHLLLGVVSALPQQQTLWLLYEQQCDKPLYSHDKSVHFCKIPCTLIHLCFCLEKNAWQLGESRDEGEVWCWSLTYRSHDVISGTSVPVQKVFSSVREGKLSKGWRWLRGRKSGGWGMVE